MMLVAPTEQPAREGSAGRCVYVRVRERARGICVCVRAPAPCLRGTEFACEELDMSFRGIRHLKREEVKATHLGIKHQPTSAPSSAKLMKTSARNSPQEPLRFILISLGFITGHFGESVQPGRRISAPHLKWM